jgi:hypothetical protein
MKFGQVSLCAQLPALCYVSARSACVHSCQHDVVLNVEFNAMLRMKSIG